MRTRSKTKKIRKYLLQDQIRDKENPLISIWIRREKSRHKKAFKMRLGTKMHKLFNAWCERFGGGKPVTAFRFFFKGKLIDGEQTAGEPRGAEDSRPKRNTRKEGSGRRTRSRNPPCLAPLWAFCEIAGTQGRPGGGAILE